MKNMVDRYPKIAEALEVLRDIEDENWEEGREYHPSNHIKLTTPEGWEK